MTNQKTGTTFIVIRHGETEWNKAGKQQGQLDSALTEQGMRQAEAMADGLSSYPIDLIYSSDLGRAAETATIISRTLGITVTPDIRLRERHLGIMQGLTKEQFFQQYPEEGIKFSANDPDYILPAGESARQRYDRSVTCVEELALRHPATTVVLVTHGGVLMSLLHRALNIPLTAKRTFSLFNGSINIFSIDQSNFWRLEVWGETYHLRKYGIATLDDN